MESTCPGSLLKKVGIIFWSLLEMECVQTRLHLVASYQYHYSVCLSVCMYVCLYVCMYVILQYCIAKQNKI
jgi:hypothetical protein